MDDNEKYNIKVVERCFKILDLACRKHTISIQDVCDELDVRSDCLPAYRERAILIRTP